MNPVYSLSFNHHLDHVVYMFVFQFLSCSAGGVELLAKQGRIKVVNTLESRLEMMSRQVLGASIVSEVS